jgi:hypothetical protein
MHENYIYFSIEYILQMYLNYAYLEIRWHDTDLNIFYHIYSRILQEFLTYKISTN